MLLWLVHFPCNSNIPLFCCHCSKLGLFLPHPVDSKNTKAQFNSETQTLSVTLRLNRELDFINFWHSLYYFSISVSLSVSLSQSVCVFVCRGVAQIVFQCGMHMHIKLSLGVLPHWRFFGAEIAACFIPQKLYFFLKIDQKNVCGGWDPGWEIDVWTFIAKHRIRHWWRGRTSWTRNLQLITSRDLETAGLTYLETRGTVFLGRLSWGTHM